MSFEHGLDSPGKELPEEVRLFQRLLIEEGEKIGISRKELFGALLDDHVASTLSQAAWDRMEEMGMAPDSIVSIEAVLSLEEGDYPDDGKPGIHEPHRPIPNSGADSITIDPKVA